MTQQPTPTKLVLRLLAVVFGSTVILALPSVALNLLDRRCAVDELLSPAWLQTRDWSLWFPLVAAGAGGFWLWKETFPALGNALKPKVVAVALGLLVQVLALFGALVLFLAMHRNWLAPPPMPVMSRLSPDQKKTAHVLYLCEFVCRWDLYVQEGDSWKMKLVGELTGDSPPLVDWTEEGQPRLLRNPNPNPLPAGTPQTVEGAAQQVVPPAPWDPMAPPPRPAQPAPPKSPANP